MLGYILTADTRQKKFWNLLGGANTGKSTTIKIIANILNTYAKNSSPLEFVESKFPSKNSPEQNLIEFAGMRLIHSSEFSGHQKWDTPRVKTLTSGGDKINARGMFKRKQTEFTFAGKLLFGSNELPSGVEPALASRIVVIPYMAQQEYLNLNLEKELDQELDKIFGWVAQGAFEYYKNGEQLLTEPVSVKLETLFYVQSKDELARWLNECVILDKKAENIITYVHDLDKNWKKWASGNHLFELARNVGHYEIVSYIKKKWGLSLIRESEGIDFFRGVKIKDDNIENKKPEQKVFGRLTKNV
jgi:phage/plasmid-associated DNA primase